MSSRIEQQIDQIEDYIDGCKFQPFSNTKIIVDRDEIEDYEHASESDARYHFGLFDHTDADIYSRIDLIERDWRTGEEKVLTSLILPEPDAFK